MTDINLAEALLKDGLMLALKMMLSMGFAVCMGIIISLLPHRRQKKERKNQ